MAKLTVSIATFNEIAGELEKQGIKANDGRAITLEKGTALQPPIDYRLVTIRRDCVIEAAKIFGHSDKTFIDLVDEIFRYVVYNEKPPEPDTKTNVIIHKNGWT